MGMDVVRLVPDGEVVQLVPKGKGRPQDGVQR